MGYGQDPSLVYVRDKQKIERFLGTEYAGTVGFCGKIYPYTVYTRLATPENPHEIVEYCYTEEQYFKCIEKYGTKKEIDKYLDNDVKSNWMRKFRNTRKRYQDYFKRDFSYLTKLFHEYKTPIWHYYTEDKLSFPNKYYITINPQLKPLQFAKAVDPFQAFQEISMYLGGILGTGNPSIPEISDRDLLEAKGFDYKFSFRKDKQK